MIWFLIRLSNNGWCFHAAFYDDETFQRKPYRAFDSSGLNAWMCCNQWVRPTQIESCHQQIRDFIYGYMYRSTKNIDVIGYRRMQQRGQWFYFCIPCRIPKSQNGRIDFAIIILFLFLYKLSLVIPIANVVLVMMDENMCVRVSLWVT